MTFRYQTTGLYLPIILLLLLPLALHAQPITITATDIRGKMEGAGSFTHHKNEEGTGLQGLVTAQGEAQVWDFSTVTYPITYSQPVEVVDHPVPGSENPHLAEANLILRLRDKDVAEEDSLIYTFLNLSDSEFSLLGFAAVGAFEDEAVIDTFIVTYDPAWVQLSLPVQYGADWTTEATWTMEFEGIVFSTTIAESNVVDGWGTLVTPAGSEAALRIWTETTTTAVMGEEVLGSTTYESIAFMTKGVLSADLNLDDAGQVIGASYTVTSAAPVSADDALSLPFTPQLAQNYPNPFNPATHIAFELPHSGHARLSVFDLQGRHVATLADGAYAAGRHQVTWEATSVPSGAYLYRLETGGTAVVRVMMLLK
jgi:hypothetical protein